MSATLSIALVQMASAPEIEKNLEFIRETLASLQGRCDLAIFPEYCLCVAGQETIRANAKRLGEIDDLLGALIRPFNIHCIFGGVPIRDNGSFRDAMLVFDDDGKLLIRYDKMHLFSYPGNPRVLDEGGLFTPGNMPHHTMVKEWKIGLSICYDLRFPELYRSYIPADLMICAAAFLKETGKAHWHPLLQARAIENQCYVAAVNQCVPECYGHSLVCDPWGKIVCEAEESPVVHTVVLEKERLNQVRDSLPALMHRHPLFRK